MDIVSRRDFVEQPDARAFGAHVEAAVLASWSEVCDACRASPLPHPGRRAIYDASFVAGDTTVGVDFRTKDLATARYSDGGICAVGNLLRWLVNERAVLLVSEFGYTIVNGRAEFTSVVTAPIHTLPLEMFRIENLGTGQVRLNGSIATSTEQIAWERPTRAFLQEFAILCRAHYQRVRARAAARDAALEEFIRSGYSRITLR